MGSLARPVALMGAFVVGGLFPQGAVLSWVIPWFVRFMLFMVFLKLDFSKMRLRRSLFAVLALNLLIGVVAFGLLNAVDRRTLALAAFFAGIAPTATAAPAIASFLKRDVEYIVTGLLLTTLGVSLALPALLPWVLGKPTPGAFLQVAGTVAGAIVAPIIAARVCRTVYPPSQNWTAACKNLTFAAWVGMVTIIASRASAFIRDPANGVQATILLEIGAVSLAICVANFALGALVGEKGFRAEASQTLGQKNTGALIYFASLYADPIVALGPTLYVLWHNCWNAIQLEALALRERKAAEAEKTASAVETNETNDANDANGANGAQN